MINLEFSRRLRFTKTYEELQQLVSDAKNKGVSLTMKRSKRVPSDFTKLENGKVSYFISDGSRMGNCEVHNLYRYMQFEE